MCEATISKTYGSRLFHKLFRHIAIFVEFSQRAEQAKSFRNSWNRTEQEMEQARQTVSVPNPILGLEHGTSAGTEGRNTGGTESRPSRHFDEIAHTKVFVVRFSLREANG